MHHTGWFCYRKPISPRLVTALLCLLLTVNLAAQDGAPKDYRLNQFDLVSINDAFLIHLMSDLDEAQKAIPLQDARLDAMHKRFPYIRAGLASIFLYETEDNPSGKAYQPEGFISIFPIGLHYPIMEKNNWHLGMTNMLYWANYTDLPHSEDITLQDFIRHHPRLTETFLSLEMSALMTINAGYRHQWWKSSSEVCTDFRTMNPHGNYSRWFTELNIGLQSLQRTSRKAILPTQAARLALSTEETELLIINADETVQIPIILRNEGKQSLRDIRLYATNDSDLPLSLSLSNENLAVLNPDTTQEITLTLNADSFLTHTVNGGIVVYALDAKGNTAETAIFIMVEKTKPEASD